MTWRLLGVLAFILSCSLGAGVARAQAYPNGSFVPEAVVPPQYRAANDPWPGRSPVRATAPVGANDNVLRGLGRSAAAVGDDLALVMGQEEANRRQAKYIRGIGKAIGGAAGGKYLSKLGRIARPIGIAVGVYEAYGLGRDIITAADPLQDSLGQGVDILGYGSISAGSRVWMPALVNGAMYPSFNEFYHSDYPLGKYFIKVANNRALWLMFVTETTDPTGLAILSEGTDSRGLPYKDIVEVYFHNDGRRLKVQSRRWDAYLPNSEILFDGGAVVCGDICWYPLYKTFPEPEKPQSQPKPAVSPIEVPPGEENQPISPEPLKEVIKKGLEEAGVQATPAQVQGYADHAAAGMKAGDLNAAPAPLGNPGSTPLGDYVPQSVADAANDPATDTAPATGTSPGTSTGTGTAAATAITDGLISADQPDLDVSWMPTMSIGSLDVKLENCPAFDLPKVGGYGGGQIDIGCSIWEGPYKPFFRGIGFVMALMVGFWAFRGR